MRTLRLFASQISDRTMQISHDCHLTYEQYTPDPDVFMWFYLSCFGQGFNYLQRYITVYETDLELLGLCICCRSGDRVFVCRTSHCWLNWLWLIAQRWGHVFSCSLEPEFRSEVWSQRYREGNKLLKCSYFQNAPWQSCRRESIMHKCVCS